jgi:hypothetical protein
MSEDEYNEYFNETSNTAAGINTPKDHEGIGATEPLDEIVEQVMDNIANGNFREADSQTRDRERS